MQKVNYNIIMHKIISGLNCRPQILLHSCCAPCSSAVLQKISQCFDVTVFYYNPNIFPEEEYNKRKEEQIRLCKILNIKFLDCDYNSADFFNNVTGLEELPEGGARCSVCFNVRLEETAKTASKIGYEFFGTTLTISPHKNADIINNIGFNLQDKYGIEYLVADFKKENGYLNSINLSREYNLYRQDYCGCKFSINS